LTSEFCATAPHALWHMRRYWEMRREITCVSANELEWGSAATTATTRTTTPPGGDSLEL
jgi:hypothetical protein